MIIKDYLLIRRIQKGDPDALETLVRKHYQNVYHFVSVAAMEISPWPLM